MEIASSKANKFQSATTTFRSRGKSLIWKEFRQLDTGDRVRRMSPLASRLTFFTRRSFQGSALERTVPLALPYPPSALRLTFFTRNVCNAAFKWSRQTSGSGSVRPLNSGEPSDVGIYCRLSLRERSATLSGLSLSGWLIINETLLD